MQDIYLQVSTVQWQVIINPNALSTQHNLYKNKLLEKLQDNHLAFRSYFPDCRGAGKSVARQCCLDGHRHFVVMGGDGTLNEVINGIFDAGIDTREVFLVLIPLGNGNDWARTQHYSQNHRHAIDSFLQGHFKLHDVGLVTVSENNTTIEERYFINIAGFCFDAEVIEEAERSDIKFLRKQRYLFALIKALFHHQYQDISIDFPDGHLTEQCFSIAVGIGQYNGNGMRQVPMAITDDGLFDTVLIRKVRVMTVLKNIKRLFAGTHIPHIKELMVKRSEEVTISSGKPVAGEVEGELLAKGDYHVTMLPCSIYVLSVQ